MLDGIVDFFSGLLDGVLSILPDDPFMPFINNLQVASWISALNWIVPIGAFATIGAAWLVAVAGFYVIKAVLRWVKVAGSS
jgi:hypothetical protein